MKTIKSENPVKYIKPCNQGDDIIKQALDVLESRLLKPSHALTSPNDVKSYLKLQFAGLEHEVFACVWLDTRHRVIKFEQLFRGTIDGAAVHVREVIKSALSLNAAAVIFAHNHPSGVPEPSQADKTLTTRLKDTLNLVDIRTLDHIVVGGVDSVSLAERGYI